MHKLRSLFIVSAFLFVFPGFNSNAQELITNRWFWDRGLHGMDYTDAASWIRTVVCLYGDIGPCIRSSYFSSPGG